MKLLIVKPSSLGDILHTFPAIAEIHAVRPNTEVTWVANDSLAQIVGLYPRLARVIPFPRKALGRWQLSKIKAFLRELRREEYDAVLDFQGLLRSGLITWLARSRQRFGFATAREGAPIFYWQAIRPPDELRHAADRNRFLAREFLRQQGIDPAPVSPEATLQLPSEWLAEAELLLSEHQLNQKGPLLAVGCASRWESKSWPPEFFAAVLQEIRRKRPDVQLWLLGAQEERARAQQVCDLAKLEGMANLAGQTSLGSLAALLARSKALFTNDSGPMHIAAALKVPCIANFGSTDPEKTGPYGPAGRHYVVRTRCPQTPCFKRKCPIGDPQACCRQADLNAAVQAILERLI